MSWYGLLLELAYTDVWRPGLFGIIFSKLAEPSSEVGPVRTEVSLGTLYAPVHSSLLPLNCRSRVQDVFEDTVHS